MVRVILERPDAARANTDHLVAAITCRVWRPSRIGPRTDPFSAVPYVADLLKLIKRHRLSPHAYTQTTLKSTGFCQLSDVNALADSVCLLRWVSSWMRANRLQVNPSKTEALWCASGRRQHQIPTSPVRIGSIYVLPVSCSRSRVHWLRRQSANTSPPPSDRALQQYVRFGAFGVVFHNTPCWHSVLWLSARSITAAPCWPASPVIYWTGCSPSSTPPPDSCSQPGALHASSRFSATFIGCGSRKGFNSVSAFWHSDVSMDQRRHISLRAFVGQPIWRCRHLRSSTTMTLIVPSVQRLTLGDRAFPVAASPAWNAYHLPSELMHPAPPFGNNWRHISFG